MHTRMPRERGFDVRFLLWSVFLSYVSSLKTRLSDLDICKTCSNHPPVPISSNTVVIHYRIQNHHDRMAHLSSPGSGFAPPCEAATEQWTNLDPKTGKPLGFELHRSAAHALRANICNEFISRYSVLRKFLFSRMDQYDGLQQQSVWGQEEPSMCVRVCSDPRVSTTSPRSSHLVIKDSRRWRSIRPVTYPSKNDNCE